MYYRLHFFEWNYWNEPTFSWYCICMTSCYISYGNILKRSENFVKPLYAWEGCFFRFCRDSMPYFDKAKRSKRTEMLREGHDRDVTDSILTSHPASVLVLRIILCPIVIICSETRHDSNNAWHKKLIKNKNNNNYNKKKYLFTNKRFWLERPLRNTSAISTNG